MKRVTQSRTRPRTTGLLVGILFLVPLLAIVNAAVGPYAVLPYLAIASMVAFFALPRSFLVMTCLVVSAVLAGLLEYFGKISQGFWLPYLMGALFALRALGERLRLGAMPTDSLVSVQRPPFGPFIVVYLAVLLFTTLVALPPMAQIVVATKNYIFLWGLMLVLLWSPWDVKDSTRFWTAVIAIACIQWPITAYQHFVVAAKRHDAAAWDAVVGTFGGSPDSGGHSAAMAMASCVAIAALLFRAREKRIGAAAAALLIGFCLLPIGLAEVKAAFIWLLMVFMLFFARQFKREPVKALMILVFGMSLLGGIGWIYKATMYEASSNGSLQVIYDKQIKYSLDPKVQFRVPSSGPRGCTGVLGPAA